MSWCEAGHVEIRIFTSFNDARPVLKLGARDERGDVLIRHNCTCKEQAHVNQYLQGVSTVKIWRVWSSPRLLTYKWIPQIESTQIQYRILLCASNCYRGNFTYVACQLCQQCRGTHQAYLLLWVKQCIWIRLVMFQAWREVATFIMPIHPPTGGEERAFLGETTCQGNVSVKTFPI